MPLGGGPTQGSPVNEYFTVATDNPDAHPKTPSPARRSVRASAIAPLTPGMSQLVATGKSTNQHANRRVNGKSEKDSEQGGGDSSDMEVDPHTHKVKSPAGPEHVSGDTVLQSLRSARASEENSRKRVRLECSDKIDEIVAVASCRKGGNDSEENVARRTRRGPDRVQSSIAGTFTVRIQAKPLAHNDSSLRGTERSATRRVLLRFDTTWREVDDTLIESASTFQMSNRWTAGYLDLDGDWIMLRNEHDLQPFLMVAEETVLKSEINRNQIPLIKIQLDDE